METPTRRSAPGWLPSLVVLLVVLVIGVAVILGLGGLRPGAGSEGASPQSEGTTVPLPDDAQSGRPSPDGTQSGEAVPAPAPTPSEDPAAGKEPVTPTIAAVDHTPGEGISARALVPGVVDLEGTCTLTVTQGDVSHEVQGQAMASADSMNCARDLTVPDDELEAGTWSVTVSYLSDTHAGTSAPATVQVIR